MRYCALSSTRTFLSESAISQGRAAIGRLRTVAETGGVGSDSRVFPLGRTKSRLPSAGRSVVISHAPPFIRAAFAAKRRPVAGSHSSGAPAHSAKPRSLTVGQTARRSRTIRSSL